jgi:hypothetical protein
MLNLVQVTDPYFASELDFHRERITDELAEAELRRRAKAARRERRQRLAKSHGQRRNAPRTA